MKRKAKRWHVWSDPQQTGNFLPHPLQTFDSADKAVEYVCWHPHWDCYRILPAGQRPGRKP